MAPAQSQSDSPAAPGPRRRSRRGGRRHSGRRAPRSTETPLPQSPGAQDESVEPDEQAGSERPPVESEAAPANAAAQTESPGQKLPPLRPAQVVRAREQSRAHEPRPQREPQRRPQREPQAEPLPERESGPKIPSITRAIEQVNEIIADLKHVLEEMDDILETLELAERQKIDDEREIENLQRALRRINRPREDEPRHH